MKIPKFLQNWIGSSKKFSPPPTQGQIVRTGYAILIKDKLSSARLWHTYGMDKETGKMDKEGIRLNPNEPLVLETNCFQEGTKVEIYERFER